MIGALVAFSSMAALFAVLWSVASGDGPAETVPLCAALLALLALTVAAVLGVASVCGGGA